MHVVSRLSLAAILAVTAFNSSGAAFDEAVSGDLSSLGTAPTSVAVAAGENLIVGTLDNTGNGRDIDAFTFSVPSGFELTAILVGPGTTTGPLGTFFAVQSGSQVTVAPDAADFTGLLGFTYYLPLNGNIISEVGIPSNGATGFIPPLGPGTYAFLLQDTGEESYDFALNFQLLATAPDQGLGMAGCAALFGVIASLNSLKRNRAAA